MTHTILLVDATARHDDSTVRDLAHNIVAKLDPDAVIIRDLCNGIAQIDADWITANWTPQEDRNPIQKAKLALSDTLISEVAAADTIVIGVPVYNFSVPVVLKAWVDQITRAGVTFESTRVGPTGLLASKRVVLAMASAGTQVRSDFDCAARYMRHVLELIGITDVEIVTHDLRLIDEDALYARAEAAFAELAA